MINLKKLLAGAILLLGSVVSIAAFAATSNYNFSITTSGGPSISGTFLNVDNSTHVVGGITGTISGGPVAGQGAITGLIGVGGISNDNKLFFPTSPYVNLNGIGFSGPNAYQYAIYNSGGYFLDRGATTFTVTSFNVSLAPSGAPEIDGKFLPQVLLLLGGSTMLCRRNRLQLAPKKAIIGAQVLAQ